jgi:signal recognition particle GTPase
VNRLIKQFSDTSKMMKKLTTGGGKRMMNMMGRRR